MWEARIAPRLRSIARRRRQDERRLRREFFARAASFTPYVAAEVGGEVFLVATRDSGVGRHLFVGRDRLDIAHLATAVRLLAEAGIETAGSTLVDVGANVGTTTVTALRRHRFERAVALEPAAENFTLLRLNLVANGVDAAVTALELAATDAGETRLLSLSAKSSGSHALTTKHPRAAAATVPVPATTLDALVARGVIDPSTVGLLWVDAPKHDVQVLAGASTLLAAGVPVVAAARARGKRWGERTTLLRSLLADYTDFADLRRDPRFEPDLDRFLGSLAGRTTDLLAVRRPAARVEPR